MANVDPRHREEALKPCSDGKEAPATQYEGNKAEHLCSVLIHTTPKGQQRPKRSQQVEVIKKNLHRTSYEGQEKRPFSADRFWKMRWEEEGCLERVKNQLPSHTENPANVECSRLNSLRNQRSHKVSALWYRCVKSKIRLFLGTFNEISPGLLKWCNQNQRLHHAPWARKKPEGTHLHPNR